MAKDKLTVSEAYMDLLKVAQMVVDWYEGRTYNDAAERTAIYNAAKKALPKKPTPTPRPRSQR